MPAGPDTSGRDPGEASRVPSDRAVLRLLVAEVHALRAELSALRERLDRPAPPAPLLTACELAPLLRVSADWVRRHSVELGGVALPDGARGPKRRQGNAKRHLRFDLGVVHERLEATSGGVEVKAGER